MVTRFGLDRGWRGAGSRISHSMRGALGGNMLSGDRSFMVSRTFLGDARRQDRGFWNDHNGCRACATRAGSFFARWPLVWTPRNCDSARIAATRIVIFQVSVLFLKLNLDIRLLNGPYKPKVVFRVTPGVVLKNHSIS
jgi:hypothetical protein